MMNDEAYECCGPTRRDMLRNGFFGFGYLAMAGMATRQAFAGGPADPLAPKFPHFPARAKRVILLFMQGGPSHVDTFDYKPELIRHAGRDVTIEYNGKSQKGKLLKPAFEFKRHGRSGLPISDAFPNLARHADDLCLLNGMHTDSPAHPQATIMAHTGSTNFVRPSMGAWTVYGLGTENQNLPGFVSINPLRNQGGSQNYGAAFLPATYQGTPIGTGGDLISNIRPAKGMSEDEQRRQLELLQANNREYGKRVTSNRDVDAVIRTYELAFQMQTEIPRVMNLSGESEATKRLYGIGRGESNRFGQQCLMARRLAEAGVRFIEISMGGWDQHKALKGRLGRNARMTDRPIAGLIQDLKQRGLFEETLIVWTGEFGRTPQGQNSDGRRHNNRGYSAWMAGGYRARAKR